MQNQYSDASMNLCEWITNNRTVNPFTEFNDRTNCDSVKVLGHIWNVKQDSISLKNSTDMVMSETPTKRSVLKQEAHGPRFAHLSDIATADMQMLCNIYPILSSQLMKISSFEQFLVLKKNIWA